MSDENAKKLSELTGLSTNEMKQIWQEVQENSKRLKECSGPHEFKAESDQPLRSAVRYRCTICQGIVDNSAFFWYLEGLKHGKKEEPLDKNYYHA